MTICGDHRVAVVAGAASRRVGAHLESHDAGDDTARAAKRVAAAAVALDAQYPAASVCADVAHA